MAKPILAEHGLPEQRLPEQRLDKLNLDTMAHRLSELGHPTRLAILKCLVKFGRKGMAVGDIQAQLGIPNSTLSHHLSRMMKADLVRQERASRTLYCFAVFSSLKGVIDFLLEECCDEEGDDMKSCGICPD